MSAILTADLSQAVDAINSGGVVAYPTEACFGLGCDPKNINALKRILAIKQRSADKGLILIAANVQSAKEYVSLDETENLKIDQILASWPGPNTWLLPAKQPEQANTMLLRGNFDSQAIRVTAHPIAQQLCSLFGGGIVSTSANIAGNPMLTSSQQVYKEFSSKIDVIVDHSIGSDSQPSTIRDGRSGKVLRGN